MRFLCFVLLTTFILSCTDFKAKHSKLIDYIPNDASLIIETNSLEGLGSNLKNNVFLEQFTSTAAYNAISAKLEFSHLLKPTENVLFGFGRDKNDSLEFTIVTPYHQDLFKRDSLKDYIEEELEYNGKSVLKSTFKNQSVYSRIIDSVFIASSSKDIIDAIDNYDFAEDGLEKIYSTTDANKTLSVIVKPDNPFIRSLFVNDSMSYKTFTDYLAVDMDMNQRKLEFHGVAKTSDTTMHLMDTFKQTVPQENQLQHLTPTNSDGCMSLTFNDFSVFHDNLNTYLKGDASSHTDPLFEHIVEIGVIYEGEQRAVALNSIDVIATSDALLAEQTVIDTFRQIEIFSFSRPDVFAETFSPFLTQTGFSMYCVLDSFFVFAADMDLLQNIIANYQNNTTIGKSTSFMEIQSHLSSASSVMMILNGNTLENTISKSFTETLKVNLDAYKFSALQFVYDSDFAHVNGIISKSKPQIRDRSITEEFSIKLDADVLNRPQFVTNHRSGDKEIVVQDIKNNLYLISNDGKVLWKKQLHGPILGTIEQIDMYKNGRLQLAFATPHRLYVIDRNGKDVAPFPGKFNDEITQPLSVFDYDKNKRYRLLVTQGRNVLMYNTQAKIVSGFTFKKANGSIVHQPQHFRIGSKDYLTIKTGNQLYILDRTGKNRVVPKTNHTYSNEALYLYRNKFTTTTADGKLVTIDTRGNTAVQDLNLGDQHHIFTSSKSLVAQSDNKLSIKGKTRELDYGSYSPPELFYINDKIYVAITDRQAQKVYLFDSQNDLIPNFPVYGNTLMDLDNIDEDRNLEFVTKGDSNSIILYQMN